MRNPVYADIISKSVTRLNKEYPGIPVGEHIAHALNGSDIYNVTDKELAELMGAYIISLELDEAFQSDDSPDYEQNE